MKSSFASAHRAFILSVFGFIAFILIAGCASDPVKSAQSDLDANAAVGLAENQVTLLNIARAYQREPRVYTDFATLTSASGSQKITLSASPSAEFDNTGPTATFSANDTQSFTYGITSPIPAKTIEYLSQQAWPNSVLLHLVVRDIRVYAKNGRIKHIYSNYPQTTPGYDLFDAVINTLSACDLTVDPTKPTTAAQPDQAPTFRFKAIGKYAAASICMSASNLTDPDHADGDRMVLSIRSPDAVIYYLGEVVRTQFDETYPPFGPTISAPQQATAPAATTAMQIYSAEGDDQTKHIRAIGSIKYSESCFYDGYGDPKTADSNCKAACNNLFVMNMDRKLIQPGGIKPKTVGSDTRSTGTAYCVIPSVAVCENPIIPQISGDQIDKNKVKYCLARNLNKIAYASTDYISPEFSVSHRRVTPAEPSSGRNYDSDPVIFSITGDYNDRAETMHIMQILEQLVSLQTTGDKPPTNSAVTMVIDPGSD